MKNVALMGLVAVVILSALSMASTANATWLDTSYAKRTCFSITNPENATRLNVTFKISLNMSRFTTRTDCKDFKWYNDTDATGAWNSTFCDTTGVANTTWWFNVPVLKTDNTTSICVYYNKTDETTFYGDIKKAGFFGDDFESGSLTGWTNGHAQPEDFTGSVTNTSSYVTNPSGNSGMYHTISVDTDNNFLMYFRGNITNTAGSVTGIQLGINATYGYSWYGIIVSGSSEQYSNGVGTGEAKASISATPNTLYDMELAHDSRGFWYIWQDGIAKYLNANVSFNNSKMFTSVSVFFKQGVGNSVTQALWTKWCRECVVSTGAEEIYTVPITLSVTQPQSITYYTYTGVNSVFSAASNSSTFRANVSVNGVVVYQNTSYINNTVVTVPLSAYLSAKTNTVIVTVENERNSASVTKTPYIFQGLNLTVINTTLSPMNCYSALFTNATNSTFKYCLNGSTLIEYSEVPTGTVTLKVNATRHDNETTTISINPTMGIPNLTLKIYRMQYFNATLSGSPLSWIPLNMTELSTGKTFIGGSPNGTVQVSLRNLTYGFQVYEFLVYGFGKINQTLQIDDNTNYDFNIPFSNSQISVNTYDERTFSGLTFNISITNGSSVYTANDVTNPKNVSWALLPNGPITITISKTGYVQRNYFTVIDPYAIINLNAYILSQGNGIFESFYVITYAGSPIENATITAQKNTGSFYQTVEQKRTGTGGSAVMFLDPFVEYYIKVEAGGYISVTFFMTPDPINPNQYIRLAFTGAVGADFVNYTTVMDAISYQFQPFDSYQNDSFTASFEISSSESDLEYFGWTVTNQTGSTICSQMVNSQPSGTTLNCAIPNATSRYDAVGYFKRVGFPNFTINKHQWWLTVPSTSSVGSAKVWQSFSDLGYLIAVLFVTIVICGFASRFLGFATGWLAILIMAMAVVINPVMNINGIAGYYIVALMFIAQIAITILRSYI